MWLFTTLGFFSVTESSDDRTKIQIRARREEDLQNLRREAKIKAPILETKNADYRYRVIVSPWKAARVMGVLMRRIDYANFKSAVAEQPGQRHKLHGLHDVWAIHKGWQPMAYEPHPDPFRRSKRDKDANKILDRLAGERQSKGR